MRIKAARLAFHNGSRIRPGAELDFPAERIEDLPSWAEPVDASLKTALVEHRAARRNARHPAAPVAAAPAAGPVLIPEDELKKFGQALQDELQRRWDDQVAPRLRGLDELQARMTEALAAAEARLAALQVSAAPAPVAPEKAEDKKQLDDKKPGGKS